MDGYGAIRSRSDRIITSSRISCNLSTCFLGFALFTLSLQYIYTRWSLNACSCSLHTLSPSPDLNKTSLASLSPLTAGQRAGRIRPPGREGVLTLSRRRGRESTTGAAVHFPPSCGAGGPPTPSSLPSFQSPTEPRPKNLKV